VVETIYATMCGQWQKEGKRKSTFPSLWDEYVSRDLLPRLFGFELMMAPYTVAHLKIGLKLAELGYKPKREERLNVFLTNTLEASQQLPLDLPGFLSKEASEAQRVKNDTQVTVIVGNPPYAGHSSNKIKWIHDLLRQKLPDGADSYFKVDGEDLGERNPKWLNDDYVKFTRYAQFRLSKSTFGVLGFITNHGYLDNPTFRGMRQSLISTFDGLWELDLHGNSKKKEKTPQGKPDGNVFDIQQGVSLNFGVVRAAASGSERQRAAASGSERQRAAARLPTFQVAASRHIMPICGERKMKSTCGAGKVLLMM
jgi:predicted helicase